jgi:hypothetical protein
LKAIDAATLGAEAFSSPIQVDLHDLMPVLP